MPSAPQFLIYFLILMRWAQLSGIAGDKDAIIHKDAISHGHNDCDINSDPSLCAAEYFVVNVTLCHIGAECFAPVHGTVVLPCDSKDGKWLHNFTLGMTSTSNLTLTNVHYNDSGRYFYNVKAQNTTEHCDYLLSVGDPPNITAPGLLCTEGCCELPIMTVYSDSDNVYQVCNTSLNPLGTTIKWCDGGTPAEKGNNKQRYKKPYYTGLAGTTVYLTCLVSNTYGITALTYVVHVMEAPFDNLSMFKKAIGLNVSRNYAKGSDVELPFAMYWHQASVAKFCHFPNNTYYLLDGFLDFNQSICCYCELDNCSSCVNFTVSSTVSPDGLFLNFTINLNDVKNKDIGLYTMCACLYQVGTQSCGTIAWIAVQMWSLDDDESFLEKNKLYFEISGGILLFLIIIFLAAVFMWCYVKGRSMKKREMAALASHEDTEDEREVLGGNSSSSGDSISGNEATTEIETTSEVAITASVVSNEMNRATSEPLQSGKNVNHVGLPPPENNTTEVTMEVPIKETGTPAASVMQVLDYRNQPGQIASREGKDIKSKPAIKPQHPIPFQTPPNRGHRSRADHKHAMAFIIYHKEDYPEKNGCISSALGLSNLLRRLGVECTIDMYDSSADINNWNQWTEDGVRNCNGHVILLCGNHLHQVLQNHSNIKIEMQAAHIRKLTLNSLIDDDEINTQFVPVFIGDQNEQLIPTALNERTYYTVPYDVVMKDYTRQEAEAVIKHQECGSLCSLVAKLTNQHEYEMPPVSDSGGSHDEMFQL